MQQEKMSSCSGENRVNHGPRQIPEPGKQTENESLSLQGATESSRRRSLPIPHGSNDAERSRQQGGSPKIGHRMGRLIQRD